MRSSRSVRPREAGPSRSDGGRARSGRSRRAPGRDVRCQGRSGWIGGVAAQRARVGRRQARRSALPDHCCGCGRLGGLMRAGHDPRFGSLSVGATWWRRTGQQRQYRFRSSRARSRARCVRCSDGVGAGQWSGASGVACHRRRTVNVRAGRVQRDWTPQQCVQISALKHQRWNTTLSHRRDLGGDIARLRTTVEFRFNV